MNPVLIVIPTLDEARGEKTGRLAVLTARCAARFVVVHDAEQQGFTKTVNRGIAQREPGEDLCILNDDIEGFCYAWLRILQTALYSSPGYGLVGPSGRSESSSGTGALGDIGLLAVKMIPFWCVVIKGEVVDRLGLLDERFIHYSSDTWYCKDVIRAGWECVWVKAAFLQHTFEGSGFQEEWRRHDTRVTRLRERRAAQARRWAKRSRSSSHKSRRKRT